MANTETLNLEVKSNIKSVTKDQKDWNKEIKKTEDSIKDVNEEGKEVVAEMQILGLSINGLKAAWTSAAGGAKFLFRSIKMGIASTGVGLLVVAFGTLATWFATTKKGAEVLSVALKGIGAAIKVIVDRVAQFGSGLFKLLTGAKGGLKQMGDSFKGIGKEILTDTLNAMALEKALQKLTDRERALNVETAQRRAEIEQLKMIAEDVTKSEEERLEAAEKAFKIESDLLDKRVENAEEAVRLEQQRLRLITDPTAEQLDLLAQKEIELANIQGESATKQIELNNKINSIKQETINKNNSIKAQRDAESLETQNMLEQLELLRIKDDHNRAIRQLEQERKDALFNAKKIEGVEEREARIAVINDTFQEKYIDLIDKNKTITIDGNKAIVSDDAKTIGIRKQLQLQFVSIMGSVMGALSGLAKQGSTEQKALALTEIAVGTGVGFIQALDIAQKSAKGTGPLAAFAFPMFYATQVLAILGAVASAKQALGSSGGGAGGGSVSTPSASSASPAPQMMSGAFELTGGQEIEPVQAYVVSDEITASQNSLEIIRRRATI